ncbi:MAG: ABC transporter substrate-binding protein, partial [Thermoproteota archaeon]
MQNMDKLKRFVPFLILLTFLAPSILQSVTSQEEQIRRPVIFVYSMEANFQPEGHFNAYSETGFIWHAGVNMYSQLAPHTLGTSKYYPELATNWTYDGNWLVVKLRNDVKWHDGQPFTSKDVW